MDTRNLTCRMPVVQADQFEEAAEMNGVLKSELLRRAVRYYVDENPDDLGAFSRENVVETGDEDYRDRDVQEEIDPGEGVYDPCGDTVSR